MNIKKILSAVLATALISSSMVVASAATIEDIVATRSPKVEFTVGDKITTAADYATATNNADKGSFVDTYDYYPVQIKVTDLGKLYNTFLKDDAIGVTSVYAVLKADSGVFVANNGGAGARVKYYSHADQSQYNAKSILFGQNTVVGREKWFGMTWVAKDGEMYPALNETSDNTIDNATMTFNTVIATAKSSTPIKINDVVVEVGYSDVNLNAASCMKEYSKANVVFGKEATVDNKWTFTKTAVTENVKDDNKLWKLDVAKTGTPGDLTSLSVKFTGKNGETDVETTRDFKANAIEAINSWNTATSFYVGLNNKSGYTNIDATFSGAAATGTTVEFK